MLRENFDAAARSVALARTLSAVLPRHPSLIDLGAGTGSLFRWLAPILGGAQTWTLADADGLLLRRAFVDIADQSLVFDLLYHFSLKRRRFCSMMAPISMPVALNVTLLK